MGTAAALAACLAPLVAAMSLGFTSPALDTMLGDVEYQGARRLAPADLAVFRFCQECGSFFSSAVNLGALFGAAAGAWFCERFGRRNAFRVSALLLGLSWAAASTTSTPALLCAARLPIGLSVGLQSVATPSYIASVSPPSRSGALGTANAAAILSGVLIVDIVGGSCSLVRTGVDGEFCSWRRLALFVAACSVILLFVALLLPTPDCRPGAPLASQQSPSAIALAAAMPPPNVADVRVPCDYRLVFAALVPMVWQQLSGINAVIFFGQGILSKADVSDYNALGDTVIAVQLTGVAIAAVVIERIGRKALLVASIAGMTLASVCLSLLLRLSAPPSMLVVGTMCAYVLFFSVGVGPVPWLLLPELELPPRLKLRVASFATAAGWACSFAVTGPPLAALEAAWGISGAFAAFAVLSALGTILIAWLVPETRPRTF